MLDALQKLPELTAVASDQQSSARMLNVVVDRTAASRLGIDPAAVDNTLYDAFGQRIISTILRLVVPRTIESSTSTMRLPSTTLRLAECFRRTPSSRTFWVGSMKVRPT